MPAEALLAIEGLDVSIDGSPVLERIALTIEHGRTLGLVGESGSGKSMTALAIMDLLPPGAVRSGSLRLTGRNIGSFDERAMRQLRGGDIGMVFQEPMTALNPLHPVGEQVAESLRLHRGLSGREAAQRAQAALERVGLSATMRAAERYPHELSGGQRQRVVIAIAIACEPALLIADEPTTALDVTTQAEILALLKALQRERGLAMLFISHDLAVVADMADEIAVMQAGRIVARGAFDAVFAPDAEPYSRQLLRASTWSPDRTAPVRDRDVLLDVERLVCSYPTGRARLFGARERLRVVDDISFSVRRGESVGLVGESGCGKSTLARALLGLTPIDDGAIRFDGAELISGRSRATRRHMQVVFQDPYGSFDPRHRIERVVAEPLHLLDTRPGRTERRRLVAGMLERVGLEPTAMSRYPHEFSGGQRQRIAIARALIVRPSFVVLDEAVSALDVSVRAQVLGLLADLAREEDLAYLFISHDLSVVRRVTDRVLVMRAGRIVEAAPTAVLFDAPQHDYTRSLLAAVPSVPTVGTLAAPGAPRP